MFSSLTRPLASLTKRFAATAATTSASLTKLPSQQKTKGERVVILGSGWAGFQIVLDAHRDMPLTVVSDRNHFVFTPLLPSAAVGTLECRYVSC